MTQFIEMDDFRQIFVVMKNEIIKTLRAKKALLYVILVFGVLALQTVLPYAVGDGLKGEAGSIFGGYVSYVQLLIVMTATLFGSYTIVSEFEERTALVIFTRPIKKSSVFFGKFLSCYMIGVVIMAAYYLISAVIVFAVTGDFVGSIWKSFIVMLGYLLACTGVSMLISSFFKKGGTCAVMTFITILLFLSIISGVLSMSGVDPWFMMDQASGAITNCIPEYVESTNAALESAGAAMGMDLGSVEVADWVKNTGVLIAWGIVTLATSFLKFIRKEF